MIVKEKFDLLKGVDNTLKLSKSQIDSVKIENGPRKVFVVLELMKSRINHYTKDAVFDLISNIKKRNSVNVVNMPDYSLGVSYNKPNKSNIINVAPFGVDDVISTKPGPQNLYALVVYTIVFSQLVSGKYKLSDKYASVITNYFVSILLRLFGKEYGLLGSFSSKIPLLKFLTNLYIFGSFFGLKGTNAYKRAAASSSYNHKDDIDKLNKFDFTNINDFILALSEMDVMPNLNKHIFTAKVLRQFGFNFLPALEDCSRFMATIATSEIKGSNVVSTYLYKYNERDFNRLLEISKDIFKKWK